MLTVVRRAVPGSTRPRRGGAAAAAAGAHQQSSTLYQTSSEQTSRSSGLRCSSIVASPSSSSTTPGGRHSPSKSSAQTHAPRPSPGWKGAAHSPEFRLVERLSPGTSARGITTKGRQGGGGARQPQPQQPGRRISGEQCSAGAECGAEMAANANHTSGGGSGGGGRGCAATGSAASRRWLWTAAAAMTAVTAATATAGTASATSSTPPSCKPDNAMRYHGRDAAAVDAAAAAPDQTCTSSSSKASLGGGLGGAGRDSGGRVSCGGPRTNSSITSTSNPAGCGGDACHRDQTENNQHQEEEEEEEKKKAGRKTAFGSSSLSAQSTPAAAIAAEASSAAEGTRGTGSSANAAAAFAGNGEQQMLAKPSWLDAGEFLLRWASALHLRGGVRAMSAGSDGSAGSTGSGGGKSGDGRGKSIPLAGRPLFTSVASTKGHRPHMEDEFFLSSDGSFSAVYDGHGGANVSEYLRRNLYKHLMDQLPPGDGIYELKTVQEALRLAFKNADDYVVTRTPYGNQGSCAVSVTVHCDKDGKVSIISCNLGDSRAVLSRGGKALDLTEDHKPNAPREMERIYRHNGMVTWEGFECSQGLQIEGTGVYRINGNLAVARAIGDIDYRPWVSADVEIKTIELKRETDQFVILASDGLWDVMSSEEAVQYVHAIMGSAMGSRKEGDRWSGGGDKLGAAAEAGGDKPPHMTLVNWTQSYAEDRGMIRAATMLRKKKMAGYLAEEALRRGSMDNTTVAIVWLQ